MNDFSERDRDEAGVSDARALTRKALKQTRQVMRDSGRLLDRAKVLPQPDDRGDSATLED